MRIVIDVRERAIIDIIEFQAKYEIEKQALDIGDILIYDKEELKLIIERKTINDLVSSIKDGRYNEQSMRLSQHDIHNHHIIYMIEGNVNTHKDKQIILSALFSLSYFKGFTVWFSHSAANTVDWIYKFANKIQKEEGKRDGYYHGGTKAPSCDDYVSCIRMTKKDNITQENIHVIMLSQIPSVSVTTASLIMQHHGTIFELYMHLKDDPSCLNDIKSTSSNGKQRKLSSLVVKNILHYFGIDG